MKNKSLSYILPLIKGWSAKADCPINCYSNTIVPNSLTVSYYKNSEYHEEGIIISENDEIINISYFIMDEFIHDYRIILKGNYSRISEECKQLILGRTPSITEFSKIESVFYKTKGRKKYLENKLGILNIDEYTNEYESKFNESEIFNLEEA